MFGREGSKWNVETCVSCSSVVEDLTLDVSIERLTEVG